MNGKLTAFAWCFRCEQVVAHSNPRDSRGRTRIWRATRSLGAGVALLFGVLAISAAPAAAGLIIKPTSLTITFPNEVFGVTGTTSSAKNATIVNPLSGQPASAIGGAIGGTNSGDFAIAGNNCPATLNPGSNCQISVTFTPGALGARTGTLTISDSTNSDVATLTLTGDGVQGKLAHASTIMFRNVVVGQTRARAVTLSNPNKVALHIDSATTGGDYAITNDPCSGNDLAAGAKCVIDVALTPTVLGTDDGTLTLTDDALGSPQSIALTGTGVLALPKFSPGGLGFGKVIVGTTSAIKTTVMTNPNTVAMTINSISITSGPFAITSTTCGSSLGAGGTCDILVDFSPPADSTPGVKLSGTLSVDDNAFKTPQVVKLSGYPELADATLSATKLEFGKVEVDTTSAPQTETLTNNNVAGSVALSFSSISLGGKFPSAYTITSNTCGASLAAGSTCDVSVTFNPTVASNPNGTGESALLTILSNAKYPKQIVTLLGVAFGTGPTPTPTVAPTETPTPTPTPTAAPTETPTPTPTPTAAPTETPTPTPTPTAAPTETPTPTPTPTAAPTETPTPTPTPTAAPTASPTPAVGPQAGDILMAGGDGGGGLPPLGVALASFGNSLATAAFYNGTTNAFNETSGNLNHDRESAVSVVLPNGKVMIVGGEHCYVTAYSGLGVFECDALNTAELYDETTQSFTLAGSGSGGTMTSYRTGPTATLIQGCNCSLDGKVLIVGGSSGSSVVSSFTPPPAGAPAGQTALNTAEIYDPTADSFAALSATVPIAASCGTDPSAPFTGLVDHSATLIPNDNGKVLIAGGDGEQFFYDASDCAFIFDPATETFSKVASMTIPREVFQLTPDGGGTNGEEILATGGAQSESAACVGLGASNGTISVTTTNTAETYDPTTDTWAATTNVMHNKRLAHGNAPYIDPSLSGSPLFGKTVVFGGVDVEAGVYPPTVSANCVGTTSLHQTTTGSTDIFDPSTHSFTATGTMNQSRNAMGAGIVGVGSNAGELMVAGGACAKGGLSSWVVGASNAGTCDSTAVADYSEFYDPAAGTWSVGPGPAAGGTPASDPASAILP
jgi:Abnormal spindle-like microcephaly-assoc'd, ASPM-SPD-2-Hydin/Kelch motif